MSESENVKTCTYAMPVILQNLPPAETVNQIVDNLNYLCSCFDEAFGVISQQISVERQKINGICERVNKAASKTEMIAKYPNKSTTVYSHCEFPTTEAVRARNGVQAVHGQSITQSTEAMKVISRPKYKLSNLERLSKPPNCDTLQLFHRVSSKTSHRKKEELIGLGRLPDWLDSVNDCLLFNTDENPYLKYAQKNALEGVEGVDREQQAKGMIAAPKTISDKTTLLDQETYDIAYRPELDDVPTFAVPSHLKGLGGGIALDMAWAGHKKRSQQIAPSGVNFAALPQLDVFDADFGDDFGFADYDPPAAPEKPPPPPQPKAAQAQSAQTASAPTTAAPPPKPKKKSGGGGGRVDLLASIRAGKKLGKASERKVAVRQKPEPVRAMSLMDHLKSKLQARNNLMRGKAHPMASDSFRQKGANSSRIAIPKLDENAVLEDEALEPMGDLDPPELSPNIDLLSTVGENLAELDQDLEANDATGLGLRSVPKAMRMSMMLDLDAMSSGSGASWDDD